MGESKNKNYKKLDGAELKNVTLERQMADTELQKQIDDLQRPDIAAKIFCKMLEESKSAETAIKNIIEESIVSIMWEKLIKFKGILLFLGYQLVILILYNLISLTTWFKILLTFVTNLLHLN